MIIVRLIKDLLNEYGKTVGYLSRESGLPYETVANVVNKNIAPTPENAEIMLGVFGVKLEDVLSLY